jgi:hypothetical protein
VLCCCRTGRSAALRCANPCNPSVPFLRVASIRSNSNDVRLFQLETDISPLRRIDGTHYEEFDYRAGHRGFRLQEFLYSIRH